MLQQLRSFDCQVPHSGMLRGPSQTKDYEVRGQGVSVTAERLAKDSLGSIARDCARKDLAADDDAEVPVVTRAAGKNELEALAPKPAPPCQGLPETPPSAQTKGSADGPPRSASDGEARAPLGPASAQHPASANGLHSSSKAVGTLALDHRRLISALHGFPLLISRACAGKKPVIRSRDGLSCQITEASSVPTCG